MNHLKKIVLIAAFLLIASQQLGWIAVSKDGHPLGDGDNAAVYHTKEACEAAPLKAHDCQPLFVDTSRPRGT